MTTPAASPSSSAEPHETLATANLLLLGKYRLLRRLGRGGMGEVWLARNEATDREFAIKLLLAKFAADADMLSRFMREAKVSGRVRHPGVVEVFDVARAPELDGAVFLVMEVLEGASLHDLVGRQKQLPLGFLLDVGIALAHALGALHDKGVIHRDIKPSNIFLHRDPGGRIVPKLLDFGISKMETTPEEGELTRSGTIVGSPRYMSPEQAAGKKDVDARADVYGLGVTLWTCAAGYSPFDSSNYNNMIVSVIATDRRPLREVLPGVPEEVSQVVARALERNRDLRHANGHELARALEEVRATVNDGSSLHSREWVEELIAATPSLSSLTSLPPSGPDASRSIDAVSISFDLPGTQQTSRVEASAAALHAPARSVADPSAYAPSLPVPVRPRGRPVALLVALGAGLVVLVLVAMRLAAPRSPLPSPPVAEATLPTVAPVATAAPLDLTDVADAAAMAPTVAPPVASAPRVTKRPQPAHAAPHTSSPPAAADPADPHHGVTSSGL